mmetsp:Transcript_93943/g.303965  ORF Transcript_93943/g.303965 Transcript_93943/m.303965 type:complete len:210 (+) Transcript_93943:761-1390(+)
MPTVLYSPRSARQLALLATLFRLGAWQASRGRARRPAIKMLPCSRTLRAERMPRLPSSVGTMQLHSVGPSLRLESRRTICMRAWAPIWSAAASCVACRHPWPQSSLGVMPPPVFIMRSFLPIWSGCALRIFGTLKRRMLPALLGLSLRWVVQSPRRGLRSTATPRGSQADFGPPSARCCRGRLPMLAWERCPPGMNLPLEARGRLGRES